MATTPSFRTLLRAVRPIYRQTHYARAVSSSSVLERYLEGYHSGCGVCISANQDPLSRTFRASKATWLSHNYYPSLPKTLHPFHSHFTIRRYSYDEGNNLAGVVEGELKTEDDGDSGSVKERQLQLLNSIISDVSEPNKQLMTKLNCATKYPPTKRGSGLRDIFHRAHLISVVTGAEVYSLAVAVFNARNHGGVDPASVDIAASLFEYAGELGDTNALYTFAQLLRTGQGVTPDAPRAANIFTDLAMKGHPYAQFALAGMYYGGLGVEQSFNRAFTLYKVCAKNFVPQAHNMLGDMYRFGQGVAEDLEEAVKHYQTGAEQGDPLAHLSLAHCYTHGKGVEESATKAFEHHLEASKSNNPVALYNVATHYFAGKGVELSFETAAEYFEKAAILQFPPAQVNLGNMYYHGLGVTQDKSKAKELYNLAAAKDKNAKALLEELEGEEKKAKEDSGASDEKT